MLVKASLLFAHRLVEMEFWSLLQGNSVMMAIKTQQMDAHNFVKFQLDGDVQQFLQDLQDRLKNLSAHQYVVMVFW